MQKCEGLETCTSRLLTLLRVNTNAVSHPQGSVALVQRRSGSVPRFPRVCCPMREVKCGRRHLAVIDMSLSNMNRGMTIRHHHICRATGRLQLN